MVSQSSYRSIILKNFHLHSLKSLHSNTGIGTTCKHEQYFINSIYHTYGEQNIYGGVSCVSATRVYVTTSNGVRLTSVRAILLNKEIPIEKYIFLSLIVCWWLLGNLPVCLQRTNRQHVNKWLHIVLKPHIGSLTPSTRELSAAKETKMSREDHVNHAWSAHIQSRVRSMQSLWPASNPVLGVLEHGHK